MSKNQNFVSYWCVLVVLISVTSRVLSQTENSDSVSVNVESYTQHLGIYLYGIQKINNFEIKAKEQNTKLEYSPNENLNLGLGFNYKWMGLGFAMNFGFINSDTELKGESKSLDLQLDIYKDRFLLNGNFQFYQGYYWKNPDAYFPDWNTEDSLVVRPDISTVTLGLNGTYVFNHDEFSFKAAYQNTERQLTSSGSWLLGVKCSLYGIAADSSMIPLEVYESYTEAVELGGLGVVNLGTAGGYTHTFIFAKHFYFNAALMIGLNLQSVNVTNLNGESIDEYAQLSSNALLRIAIGCNKESHFYGFTVSTDSYLVRKSDDVEFSYNYGKVRFYYGRRINMTK